VCPKGRKFHKILENIQLKEHRNFLPTPVKDEDEDHYKSLPILLAGVYYSPDFDLPYNDAAKNKPIVCGDCDTVCTSQKDYHKHRRYIHDQAQEEKKEKEKISGVVEASSHRKTPKKPNLKRSRSPKKSPEESSPKKKICFMKYDEEIGDVEHDDEDTISPDELDFFKGSTTFGRQVRELGTRESRNARRKSD